VVLLKPCIRGTADRVQPRSQIQHLQRILVDLGMQGNPTMGKAKSLKQARELAAELSEFGGPKTVICDADALQKTCEISKRHVESRPGSGCGGQAARRPRLPSDQIGKIAQKKSRRLQRR
jgi:hypothetical protein